MRALLEVDMRLMAGMREQIMDLERENAALKEELASAGPGSARKGRDEDWVPGRGGGAKHTLVRRHLSALLAGRGVLMVVRRRADTDHPLLPSLSIPSSPTSSRQAKTALSRFARPFALGASRTLTI